MDVHFTRFDFLKTYQKEKKKKKKKKKQKPKTLISPDFLSTDLPFPADNLSSSSSRFGAADPT